MSCLLLVGCGISKGIYEDITFEVIVMLVLSLTCSFAYKTLDLLFLTLDMLEISTLDPQNNP